MPSNWLPENNKFSPQKIRKLKEIPSEDVRRSLDVLSRSNRPWLISKEFASIVLSPVSIVAPSALKNKNKNPKSLDFHLNYKFFRFQLSSYRIDIAFFILAHSFVSPHDARRWSHPTEFCNFCFCQSLFEKGLAATGAESIPLRILLDFLSRMIFRNFSFLSIKVTSGVGVFIRSGAFFLAFMLILSSPGSTGTANNWWK